MVTRNPLAVIREGTGMLSCPRCRNPMRIRTIEIVELRERIRLACDSCRCEAVHELPKSSNQPQRHSR